MTTTPCRGCGKPIVMALDDKGQWIPCDPRPPIYDVTVVEGAPHRAARARGVTNGLGQTVTPMVTHFATCPDASRFSKKAPRSPERAVQGTGDHPGADT